MRLPQLIRFLFSKHRCDLCQITFKTYRGYKEHVTKIHYKPKPFKEDYISDEGVWINDQQAEYGP